MDTKVDADSLSSKHVPQHVTRRPLLIQSSCSVYVCTKLDTYLPLSYRVSQHFTRSPTVTKSQRIVYVDTRVAQRVALHVTRPPPLTQSLRVSCVWKCTKVDPISIRHRSSKVSMHTDVHVHAHVYHMYTLNYCLKRQ